MSETPEQLAEKVRAGIKTMASSVRLEADAALDALLACIAEAENGEDAAGRMLSAVNEQRLAAEADRDRYRDALEGWEARDNGDGTSVLQRGVGDDAETIFEGTYEQVEAVELFLAAALDPEQKP